MKKKSTRWYRPAVAAGIMILGLAAITLSFVASEVQLANGSFSIKWPPLKVLIAAENWFYDLRSSRLYQHREKSPHLVIVELTDASLNKFGRWPWTRTRHAELIDRLRAYGVKTVMFDVLFAEPESKEADGALAAAVKNFSAAPGHSIIFGYGLTHDPNSALTKLPDDLMLSALSSKPISHRMADAGFVDKNNFSFPELYSSGAQFGFIVANPDSDGIFRHSRLFTELNQSYYPSLALAGFNAFYADGQQRNLTVEASGSNYALHVSGPEGENFFPLGPQGDMRVRFYGGADSFLRVPAEEILSDPKPEANERLRGIFQGKAVLFGSSALGAHDLRHTPVDAQMPGMYTHANLFHSIDQNFIFRPEETWLALSLFLYFLGIAGVLASSRLKDPLLETGLALALAAAIYFVDYLFFLPKGYVTSLFSCLTGMIGLFAWFNLLNLMHEAREKKRIRDTFTRYVAPKIVKAMLADPSKLRVGGEKKNISMLFSDVRDFTSISEKLSAQDLSMLLNLYMGRMTDILFECDGTLDKYIGDAMIGLWGAPLDLPDHAYKAVTGARRMLDALPEVNKTFRERGLPEISVGIGLNTGEVSVGNMGSEKIFQYTALGDNMNLAARLEGLTKYYGVGCLLSEYTVEALGAQAAEFSLRPLDLVQVKGKSIPVKIFELLPSRTSLSKSDLEKFRRAYEELYLQKKFREAVEQLDSLLRVHPTDHSALELKRKAELFIQNPPPDSWNGTTVFQTK